MLSTALLIGLVCAPAVVSAAGMRPIEMKNRYREILGVLASGDGDRALAELMEFEQAVIGDDKPWQQIDSFWRLKLKVIRDLLSHQQMDLLMPVIVLHHDAYYAYAEAGRRHLAQHSRRMASELAEVYPEKAGTPESRVFGGRILTSFGVHLWSPSAIGESAYLFYRTLLIDPANELALRGLAAAHERSGEYEEAIEVLSRALDLDAGDPELRLRLALCRLRSEREASPETLTMLTALSDPEVPSWIRSVAYQERVRLRMDSREDEEAEALVREGLAGLEGDQQLSLQLAAILDRQYRRSEVIQALDAIPPDRWQSDSPRQQYDFWRPQGGEKVRQRLHEEMKKGLAALADGLAAAASEEAES